MTFMPAACSGDLDGSSSRKVRGRRRGVGQLGWPVADVHESHPSAREMRTGSD